MWIVLDEWKNTVPCPLQILTVPLIGFHQMGTSENLVHVLMALRSENQG